MAASPETLLAVFGVVPELGGVLFPPRYNVAPTDVMPVVTGRRGERMVKLLRWGLLPIWAKDPKEGAKMINARADGVATKPAFRVPFRTRRCLVPADGWYEWEKPSRQAWLFRRPDRGLFAFGGLWETWRGPAGPVGTFTVITTEANTTCRFAHARMPLLLPTGAWDAWLDPDADPEILVHILQPAPADVVVARRVGARVGNVRNDDPEVSAEEGAATLNE